MAPHRIASIDDSAAGRQPQTPRCPSRLRVLELRAGSLNTKRRKDLQKAGVQCFRMNTGAGPKLMERKCGLKNQRERNLHLSRLISGGRHDSKVGAVYNTTGSGEHNVIKSIECFKTERKGHLFADRKSTKDRTVEIPD